MRAHARLAGWTIREVASRIFQVLAIGGLIWPATRGRLEKLVYLRVGQV
jgi:hypothetical protein